jgi:hypothetical protein
MYRTILRRGCRSVEARVEPINLKRSAVLRIALLGFFGGSPAGAQQPARALEAASHWEHRCDAPLVRMSILQRAEARSVD